MGDHDMEVMTGVEGEVVLGKIELSELDKQFSG